MNGLLFSIIIYPIIFIFPAYVANGSPVIFGRRAKTPLDLGRRFRNKPIFGMHKTVRGLVGGLACGIIVGFIESLVPGYGFMLAVGILESFGTHVGDLLGSFIKRQSGVREGAQTNLLDQYLFLVFALLFAYPLGHTPGVYGIIFLIAFTYILHRATNLGAYKLKIKKVPW